jgi:hypothetical protein
MTKSSDKKKPKDKQEEDWSKINPDDIARRFLESPPKPKKKEKNK